MPRVARLGDSTSTGHGCTGTTTITGPTGASAKVYANNIPVECKGNPTVVHSYGGNNCSATHAAAINVGSATVFVANIELARIGDSTDGGAIISGSPDVYAGPSGGEPPPYVVPLVVIPKAVQAAADRKTAAYVAKPSNYKVQSNDQVKRYFAGSPQQPSTVGQSLIDPTVAAGSDIPSMLSKILQEAATGVWEETGMGGKPSNPNIIGIWNELGYPQKGAWLTDQTAWCMGFVNYVLKKTGYRFIQTAWALDIKNRSAAYNSTQIPLNQGQPGDVCLWSYGHVNFIYTANNGAYTFVGGNQSSSAKNANNPSSGSVTKSWPNGYKSPGDGSLVGIWRPSKA